MAKDKNECDCFDCQMLKKYGTLEKVKENVPNTIVFPDGTWGCYYCAGVGYEDYPSCKIPCRIPGHKNKHDKTVKELLKIFPRKFED